VTESKSLLERLKARGEQVWERVSAELMSNPRFVRALQGAVKGKETLDRAVARALKTMNIPTRSEFKKVVARLDAVERELSDLKAKARRRPRRRPAPAAPKPVAAAPQPEPAAPEDPAGGGAEP
jgi:hypothetical protein